MSSEHLKPTGGVGQFAKSFIELMLKHNIKVDIITDQMPYNKEFVYELNTNVIYPTDPYKYTTHRNIFMYGDSYNFERMANFRNSIIKALSKNLYDCFVLNPYESVQLANTMGLEDCIQLIAYTHLESQIFKDTHNPFLDNVNNMMRKQLETPGLYVGTQSKYNELELSEKGIASYHLPIPLPEQSLLEEYHNSREGVLFIGRWEPGKNPELFCELIEKTKLPARVITSENGVKKFEERFKKIGVDYVIKAGIIGKEKVDFITGCRVAFNPSTVESYGIAFHEQQLQMPTVALQGMRWHNNFDSKYYHTCTKKNMDSVVLDLYNKYDTAKSYYETGVLKHYQALENSIYTKWNEVYKLFTCKESKTKTAGILNHKTIKYSDYVDSLNRSILCIDDIRSVYSNKYRYNIIYTDNDTWLSQDPNFVLPSTEETNLFEGL
jgi:hypothetical protein